MSTFVGDSGDWSSTSVAWPAGVQVGDLAVMALVTKLNVGGLSEFPWAVPEGWVTAATDVFKGRMWTYGVSPTLETAGIAWKVVDRKSTHLNSSHSGESRMPSSA